MRRDGTQSERDYLGDRGMPEPGSNDPPPSVVDDRAAQLRSQWSQHRLRLRHGLTRWRAQSASFPPSLRTQID
jgi:hypothetical protein